MELKPVDVSLKMNVPVFLDDVLGIFDSTKINSEQDQWNSYKSNLEDIKSTLHYK